VPVKHSTSQHSLHPQRVFLLRLLSESNPAYDAAVKAVIAAFPQRSRWLAGISAVRSVRLLMWDRLVITEADESLWLTKRGRQAAAELPGLELAEVST
jgi:hypothetical protein